ncbi:MAG: TonB-dependent receptor plug domain-containing protein, partial [Bacteroidota bacterium]
MKKNLLLLMLLCPILLGAQSFEPEPIMRLTGVVVDEENKPIANASIAKLNSLKETETDENGTFTIDASPGDILRCSALFKETEEVTITGNPIIEVVLKPDMGLLEEVLLIKKKEEEVKNTAFGKKRGVSLGYEANNVASQFISPIDVDMTTVIRKIPGIDFSGNGLDFSFSLRKNKGINPTPVLVVLDGVPVDQNIVNFIDPSTIASLTILRSLAATVRYGTLGVGGVMLIETKMAASLKEEPEPQPVKLSEQERNYKDELKLAQAYFSETTPDYLHTLSKAQNFEEARKIYTRLSKEPRSNTL